MYFFSCHIEKKLSTVIFVNYKTAGKKKTKKEKLHKKFMYKLLNIGILNINNIFFFFLFISKQILILANLFLHKLLPIMLQMLTIITV